MLMILNSQQNCGKEKVAVLHQNESSWWQLPYQCEVKKKIKSKKEKGVLFLVIFETILLIPDLCLSYVIHVIISGQNKA